MKKRGSSAIIIIIVLAILFSIGLGGYLLYINSNNEIHIVNQADELCQEYSPDEQYECYVSFALEEDEIAICDQAGVKLKEQYCPNPGIDSPIFSYLSCDILEEFAAGECIGNIALNKNDPNYCENGNTPKKKDFCYYHYAAETNDIDICDLIDHGIINIECSLGKKAPNPIDNFVMNPPFLGGEVLIHDFTDSISVKISNENTEPIYLISSADGLNDGIEVSLVGDRSGRCEVAVLGTFDDVLFDEENPESDGSDDIESEILWPAGEIYTFFSLCRDDPTGGPGNDWDEGETIRAEVRINYKLESSSITQVGTGDIIAVSK